VFSAEGQESLDFSEMEENGYFVEGFNYKNINVSVFFNVRFYPNGKYYDP